MREEVARDKQRGKGPRREQPNSSPDSVSAEVGRETQATEGWTLCPGCRRHSAFPGRKDGSEGSANGGEAERSRQRECRLYV